MPRNHRIPSTNSWYHVVCRGNRKGPIFLDDEDRFLFAEILLDVLMNDKIICATYCLMDNHFHILLSTPEANISRAMQRLNGRYAQAFNKKYQLSGHLFQGRFYSSLIETEFHFLTIARYIELNPVTADLVGSPESWKWSGYRGLIGIESCAPFLSPEYVWSLFSSDYQMSEKLYKSYVLGEATLDNLGFIEEKNIVFLDGLPKKVRPRPSLKELLKEIRSKEDRDTRIILASLLYRYTGAEIAKQLALNSSTVTRIIKKYPENIEMHDAGSDPQI